MLLGLECAYETALFLASVEFCKMQLMLIVNKLLKFPTYCLFDIGHCR